MGAPLAPPDWTQRAIGVSPGRDRWRRTKRALVWLLSRVLSNPAKETAVRVRVLLIVEDDRDTNEAIINTLKDAGYSCLAAFDGERGLDLLTKHEPDLV